MDDKKQKDDEKASEDTDLGQPVETEDGEQPEPPPPVDPGNLPEPPRRQ